MKNLKVTALSFALVASLAGCGKTPEVTLEDFELDITAANTMFALNEEFTSEGVKVVAKFSDGSTEEIELAEDAIVAPDMSTTGEKEVTVNFSYGGEEQTETYKINVSYWEEEDLAVFEECSFFGVVETPFPYLAGMEVTDSESNNQGFWFELACKNATVEDYEDYVEMLDSIEQTDEEGYIYDAEIMAKIPSGAKEFITEKELAKGPSTVDEETGETIEGDKLISVFRLIPHFASNGSFYRIYNFDEYIVVALDEDGTLLVKNRLVYSEPCTQIIQHGYDNYPYNYNSAFDYSTFNSGYWYIYPSDTTSPLTKSNGYIATKYGEVATESFVLPKVDTEDAMFGMTDLAMGQPFNLKLDDYKLSYLFEFGGMTSDDRENYVLDLKKAGFEKTDTVSYLTESETGFVTETYDVYEMNDKFRGYSEYYVGAFDPDFVQPGVGGFEVEIYYDVPDFKVSKAEAYMIEDFLEPLGLDFQAAGVKNDQCTAIDYSRPLGAGATGFTALQAACAQVVNNDTVKYLKGVKPTQPAEGVGFAQLLCEGYAVTIRCTIVTVNGVNYAQYFVTSEAFYDGFTTEMVASDLAKAYSAYKLSFTEVVEGVFMGHLDGMWINTLGTMYLSYLYEEATYSTGTESYLPDYLEQICMPLGEPYYVSKTGCSSLTYVYATPTRDVVVIIDTYLDDVTYTKADGLTGEPVYDIIVMPFETYYNANLLGEDPAFEEVADFIAQKLVSGYSGVTAAAVFTKKSGYYSSGYTYALSSGLGYSSSNLSTYLTEILEELFMRASSYLPFDAVTVGKIYSYSGTYIMEYYCGDILVEIYIGFQEADDDFYQPMVCFYINE